MTNEEKNDLIRRLPAILAGREPDPIGIARDIQMRAGLALLQEISRDFMTKARGGTGRDGIKWKPLHPSTIARRRTSQSERRELGIGGKRTRGLLTPSQDERWKKIYGTRLARLRLQMSEGEARATAAQIAWATLKREGAQTKIAVLGGRQVEIGKDTVRMFRSLTPSIGVDEQIFEFGPGTVTVGSNVPYFPHFHKVRPVWPRDGGIPTAWMPAIQRAVDAGMKDAIERIRRM